MRDNSELKVEAEKLRKMQPNVRRKSIFGDNHHDAIDKQIEVLLDDSIEERDILDELGSEYIAKNVSDAAIAAIEWRDEDSEDVPSDEWQSLLRLKAPRHRKPLRGED